MLGPCSCCILQFNNHLAEEGGAGCFTTIVLLLSCDCICSVSFPYGAMGWFAVCDFGISWSYTFTFNILPEVTLARLLDDLICIFSKGRFYSVTSFLSYTKRGIK